MRVCWSCLHRRRRRPRLHSSMPLPCRNAATRNCSRVAGETRRAKRVLSTTASRPHKRMSPAPIAPPPSALQRSSPQTSALGQRPSTASLRATCGRARCCKPSISMSTSRSRAKRRSIHACENCANTPVARRRRCPRQAQVHRDARVNSRHTNKNERGSTISRSRLACTRIHCDSPRFAELLGLHPCETFARTTHRVIYELAGKQRAVDGNQ